MRRRSREGAEPYHGRHVESQAEVVDGIGEGAPLDVGFRTGQVQDVSALAVDARAQLDLRPAKLGGDAIDDPCDRSSSTLVEELVGVEGGHQVGGRAAEERAHRS